MPKRTDQAGGKPAEDAPPVGATPEPLSAPRPSSKTAPALTFSVVVKTGKMIVEAVPGLKVFVRTDTMFVTPGVVTAAEVNAALGRAVIAGDDDGGRQVYLVHVLWGEEVEEIVGHDHGDLRKQLVDWLVPRGVHVLPK